MDATVCVCCTLSISLSRHRLTSITSSRRDTWSPLHKVLSLVCGNYFADNLSPVPLLWIITHSKWFVSLCFSPQQEDTEFPGCRWIHKASGLFIADCWRETEAAGKVQNQRMLYGALNKKTLEASVSNESTHCLWETYQKIHKRATVHPSYSINMLNLVL